MASTDKVFTKLLGDHLLNAKGIHYMRIENGLYNFRGRSANRYQTRKTRPRLC